MLGGRRVGQADRAAALSSVGQQQRSGRGRPGGEMRPRRAPVTSASGVPLPASETVLTLLLKQVCRSFNKLSDALISLPPNYVQLTLLDLLRTGTFGTKLMQLLFDRENLGLRIRSLLQRYSLMGHTPC